MGGSGDDKRPSQVLDHLFIGSRAHAKNRGLLKELGINRILNVTPPKTMDPTNGVPNFFEKDRSMTYKRVAVFDNRGEDLLQHLNECIAFIEQGSFYGKVLVHCNKGVSRSSTVVAAYLMSTRGLTKDEAITYLRSRRSIVCPHEGFMSQLEAFDGRLKGGRDAAIAEGRPKKYPDDLLQAGSRGMSQGPSIGPSRGPSAAVSGPNKRVRNNSPSRVGETASREAPQGPSIGPSIGPSRGPSVTFPGPKKRARNSSPSREEPSRGADIGPSPPRSSGAAGRASSLSPPRQRVTMIGPPRGPSPPATSLPPEAAGSRESSSGKEAQTGGAARGSGDDSGVVRSGGGDNGGASSEPANGLTSKRNSDDGAEIKPTLIGPPARPGSEVREDEELNLCGVSEEAVGMIGPVLGRPKDVDSEGCNTGNAAGIAAVENGGDCGSALDGNKRKSKGEEMGDTSVGSAQKTRTDEWYTADSDKAEG